MKKSLALIIGSVLILSLCGCTDTPPKEPNNKNESVSTISSSAETIKAEAYKKHYENLSFSDSLTVSVPPVDTLYEVELSRNNTIGFEDCFKKFDTLFDEYMADEYANADKQDIYRFISNEIQINEAETYPYIYPAIADYSEKLKTGEIKFQELFIDTDKGYLSLQYPGVIHAINHGKAARLAGADGVVGMFTPSSVFQEIQEYNDFNSQDQYTFNSTIMTVSEVAEMSGNLLDLLTYQSELKPKIVKMKVLDLGNGQNGCSMFVTKTLDNVPFDVYDMQNEEGFSWKGASDKREFELMPAYLFFMEPDDLDIVISYDDMYEIKRLNEYQSVLGFSSATDILSESFAPEMDLNVKSAELLYALYHLNDSSEVLRNEIVWKYTAFSETENLTYIIYVNAVSGNCRYYTY